MKIKNILILAAGDGDRFWPLKDKNIFNFLGKPLIGHMVDQIKDKTENLFVIASKNNQEKIKEVLPDNIHVLIQDETLLGMAGAVMAAKNQIKGEAIILNSSDVLNFNIIDHLIKRSDEKKEDIIFTAKKYDKYFPGGYLRLSKDKVVEIVEKPGSENMPSNSVKLVCDYFRSFEKLIDCLEQNKTDKDDWYETGLNQFINENNSGYLDYDDYWFALKYPWHILPLMEFYLRQINNNCLGKSHKNTVIIPPVFIGKNVKIGNFVKISGPTFIGDNTIIGDHVLIRQSHIGNNSLIGSFSEVCRSYIDDKVSLHRNYVGDSVIGQNVLFGAGAATANFRFDEKNILSIINNNKLDTNLPKLGAIVGEDSKIGVNTTLFPGIKIGKGTFVGPGSLIDTDIVDKQFVYKDKIVNNLLIK